MRSQTILVVARIGAERIAPGTPHSQNQNTKEKITRTGLSVNRLARSIGVAVSPSITWMRDIERRREQGLPGRGDRERAGEQENEKSCGGPENRNIVQNECDRPP